MISRATLWLSIFILTIGFTVLEVVKGYWDFLVWSPPKVVTTVVARGMGLADIAVKLTSLGAIRSTYWFQLQAYWDDQASLQAGEYRFEPGDTPPTILARMHRGQVLRHKIVVPEGWSVKQISQRMRQQGLITTDLKDQIELLSRLPREMPSPEGWLFPDTYYYRIEDPLDSILRRMIEKSQKVLKEEWATRDSAITTLTTPYQALILASVIEKETGRAGERRRVAAVFHNRLLKGMKLESDPTIGYGIPNFDGVLTHQLVRTPNPYNTYTITGLPPTPICNPGREAIHAALHPSKNNDLFFVARGDGSHAFSETLEGHNHNVQQYIKFKKTGQVNTE